jgi:hypothetical protein
VEQPTSVTFLAPLGKRISPRSEAQRWVRREGGMGGGALGRPFVSPPHPITTSGRRVRRGPKFTTFLPRDRRWGTQLALTLENKKPGLKLFPGFGNKTHNTRPALPNDLTFLAPFLLVPAVLVGTGYSPSPQASGHF